MADKEQLEGVKPSFREAVAKHAPQVVREELPTIQMDDDLRAESQILLSMTPHQRN